MLRILLTSAKYTGITLVSTTAGYTGTFIFNDCCNYPHSIKDITRILMVSPMHLGGLLSHMTLVSICGNTKIGIIPLSIASFSYVVGCGIARNEHEF